MQGINLVGSRKYRNSTCERSPQTSVFALHLLCYPRSTTSPIIWRAPAKREPPLSVGACATQPFVLTHPFKTSSVVLCSCICPVRCRRAPLHVRPHVRLCDWWYTCGGLRPGLSGDCSKVRVVCPMFAQDISSCDRPRPPTEDCLS